MAAAAAPAEIVGVVIRDGGGCLRSGCGGRGPLRIRIGIGIDSGSAATLAPACVSPPHCLGRTGIADKEKERKWLI